MSLATAHLAEFADAYIDEALDLGIDPALIQQAIDRGTARPGTLLRELSDLLARRRAARPVAAPLDPRPPKKRPRWRDLAGAVAFVGVVLAAFGSVVWAVVSAAFWFGGGLFAAAKLLREMERDATEKNPLTVASASKAFETEAAQWPSGRDSVPESWHGAERLGKLEAMFARLEDALAWQDARPDVAIVTPALDMIGRVREAQARVASVEQANEALARELTAYGERIAALEAELGASGAQRDLFAAKGGRA